MGDSPILITSIVNLIFSWYFSSAFLKRLSFLVLHFPAEKFKPNIRRTQSFILGPYSDKVGMWELETFSIQRKVAIALPRNRAITNIIGPNSVGNLNKIVFKLFEYKVNINLRIVTHIDIYTKCCYALAS